MAQPAEMGKDGGQSGALNQVRVSDLVQPSFTEYASETAQMETVQSLLLGNQVSLE